MAPCEKSALCAAVLRTRKFVTAGGDRGLHQLPKRSRNFSNVRTLNLV